MTEPMPQPLVYPACRHCMTPYVYRRVTTFTPKGSQLRVTEEWVWQRDCGRTGTAAHRKVCRAAPATLVDLRPKTKKTKKTKK